MPVHPVPAVSPTGTGAVQLWPRALLPEGRRGVCCVNSGVDGSFSWCFWLGHGRGSRGPSSLGHTDTMAWTLAGLLAWRHHERGHLPLYLSGSGRTFISVIQPIRKAFPPLSSPATWLGFLEPEDGAGSLPTSRALLWLGQPWAAGCGRGRDAPWLWAAGVSTPPSGHLPGTSLLP